MPSGKPESSNLSIVTKARSADAAERSQAIEYIVTAHWKPLYKYLRAHHRLSHADASAILTNFLTQLEERLFLSKFGGRNIPLREFLRQELDVFIPTPAARNAVASSPAFDFRGADEEFLADQLAPVQSALDYYNNEWVRTILTLAVEELHNKLAEEGKSRDVALFMKLDLQDRSGDVRLSLESIANELSIPMNEAWNSLAQTRQRFQGILIDLIRSFTSSEAEFRREAQAFFHS